MRSLCTDLLIKYPAQDFVLVTLKTLTQLAAATLVDIPEQVSHFISKFFYNSLFALSRRRLFKVKLLVKYVAEEPRWNVRMAAQSGLYTLAKHGSYYWSESTVTDLINVASSTDSEKLTSYIFDILIILSQSPAICQMYHQSSKLNIAFLEQHITSINFSMPFQILR